MSECRIFSSDSHVVEPRDLWEKRIDHQFRERGPRLVREGDNDQWICDGMRFGAIGINQQAGLRFEHPEKLTVEGTMSTVPLGGLDPHEHVKDMETDGVSGAVLYPSQGLTIYRVPASDVLSAALRTYNDYLAEFCSPYPNQLKGIAMINLDDVEEGVRELGRAAKIELAGAMISVNPILPYDHPAYERFWATAQDLDMPLSLHVATARWKPGMDVTSFALQAAADFPNREYEPRQCVYGMIFAGVFERYPNLRVGVVEYEVSWAPYFLARMDEFYKQRAVGVHGRRFAEGQLPSDVFRSNIFIGFQEDALGIQMRYHIGVDNLLWGSDYPHAESTFPRSKQILQQTLDGVPDDEKAKIAGGNTARLYHFD